MYSNNRCQDCLEHCQCSKRLQRLGITSRRARLGSPSYLSDLSTFPQPHHAFDQSTKLEGSTTRTLIILHIQWILEPLQRPPSTVLRDTAAVPFTVMSRIDPTSGCYKPSVVECYGKAMDLDRQEPCCESWRRSARHAVCCQEVATVWHITKVKTAGMPYHSCRTCQRGSDGQRGRQHCTIGNPKI